MAKVSRKMRVTSDIGDAVRGILLEFQKDMLEIEGPEAEALAERFIKTRRGRFHVFADIEIVPE